MIKAKRKIFKVSELVPADYNPRKIDKKQRSGLKKSLDKFGYLQDIIVNIRDDKNIIVGGHRRLEELRFDLSEEIECTIVDLNELQEKALNVSLNNRYISGDYDSEGLEKILAELKDGLEDFDELNFDDLAVEYDFSFEEDEQKSDGDNIPEVPETPIIKLGDLIEMGGHRLLCGDSTDINQVERLMEGEKADMVFTDPPYNVAYTSRVFKTKIKNDNLNFSDFDRFINKVFKNIYASMAENSVAYIFHALPQFNFSQVQNFEWEINNIIIWVKDIPAFPKGHYNWQYEPIFFLLKGQPKWKGDKTQTNVWEVRAIHSAMSHDDNGKKWFSGGLKGLTLHPTQKPIKLAERAISNHKCDSVLDLFLGSGSTLIACEKTNHKCYGMELDEKYCQVIIQRWCDYTGKSKIKINGESVDWNEYRS